MSQRPNVQRALAVANNQGGVISRSQLLAIGVSPRAVNGYLADGLWRPTDRGVIWTAPSDPPWLAQVWSASLFAGDGAVAALNTSARLLGIIDEEQLPIQFMIPQDRRVRARPYATYRRGRSDTRRYRSSGGLWCVGVEDTILDLCSISTPREIVALVTAAAQRRLTTAPRLARALEQRRAVKHRELLEKLLDDVGSGVHSVLELDYVDRVERPHGLPTAHRQAHAGSEREWVDNLYEEVGLIVEVDGRRWHADAFRDRARDNRNTRAGHPTLRYGPEEIFVEPCGVAVEVASELTQLGWAGLFVRCANCP